MEPPAPPRRLTATVSGRVQGVGFRYETARWAQRLGIRGWVKNRLDGTVEITAEADEPALRALEMFLRRGPRMANVQRITVYWDAARGDLNPFEIR